ncbi:transglutaminase domain-containing protein [Pinibacter soli]|uniref:Transglutaminase domain-containing protein n=1 Tax=Pinibacter soli TaxID=3044211 RepID=A0ABT6RCI6_9BACT|nr:transglutaminase domain-containing protein [Pinibacter soli]MDI3320284.1 transglutaminase domain-containing protein [Pinibacter soli]
MKLKQTLSILTFAMVLVISACSKSGNSTPDNNQQNPPPTNNFPKPKSQQEITDLLTTAIKALTPTIYMDMSVMNLSESQISITTANAFSSATSNDNSLKYAYTIVQTYNSTAKILAVDIKYMPFKLGIDPNNVPAGTKKVNSYNDLITAVASSPLGQEIQIAITNKNLDVNTMQTILGAQTGYGFIVYLFNADATSITASAGPKGLPSAPTDMNDCITRINRCKDSVTQILARIITPGMTSDQKFTAIYNFVTPTAYDYNYSTPNLDYNSQSAFGVFVNKKAVCSGYSWAINMLANAAGIQCYNVSGYGGGVAHAWNRVSYNGGYYYFDATWDNPFTAPRTYQYFSLTEAALLQKNHTWNNTMINALVAEK